MSLTESIGIDLGVVPGAPGTLTAAREAGARLVRARFALGDRAIADEGFLSEAAAFAAAAEELGLRVLGVIDGNLTVAPGGAGAFAEEAPDGIVDAWSEELGANASRLVGAVRGRVTAWEVLPAPNAGSPHRIAPGRWAALVARVAERVRQVDPGAALIAGGLVSDEDDDGVDYLHAAFRAGVDSGAWLPGAVPFDAPAIRLDVLPDGGLTEDDVSAVLSERTRRLWRVLENLLGAEEAARRGILVTGVSWDAGRCGEDLQGRNTWTALDTLTADPVVRAAVWSALVDGPGHARGLHRGDAATTDRRRPAWRAFHDFTLYAAQISPAPAVFAFGAGPIALTEPPQPFEPPAPPEAVEPWPPVAAPQPPEPSQPFEPPAPPEPPEAVEPWPPVAAPQPPEAVEPWPPVAAPAPPEPSQPVEAPEPPEPSQPFDPPEPPEPPEAVEEPHERTIAFRIPDAAAVLTEQGLTDAELQSALAAVVAKYGGYEWLPPGDYAVTVPLQPQAPPPPAYTNQQIISALYRAGGGTWAVLDKSGLLLSDLAARREQPYAGPPLENLSALSDDELARVRDALQSLSRED